MAKVVRLVTENDQFQQIEVLRRNREKRTKTGKIFVEGVNMINRLVESRWPIESLIYSNERKLSGWAQNYLKTVPCDTHYALTDRLLEQISEKEETSEIIAIARPPKVRLEDIKIHDRLLVAISDRPSNPGNLGSLVRSCDWFQVDCLIMAGHSVDLFDPVTIRSSVGAVFSLPVVRLESNDQLTRWMDHVRIQLPDFQIVGTTVKTETFIDGLDYRRPTALMFGNETTGLSEGFRNLADQMVKIPGGGVVSSLNVSSAASIFLYEVDRQRRTGH